jgi:micrococcal nuclease
MLCELMAICLPLTGVPSVHDGDTVRIGGQSIRLYGIDAEELNEPHGIAARDELVTLVGNRPIICRPTGEKSHKRVVARCYVDGVEINKLLVARGVVLDCAHYSHGEYRAYEPLWARARLIQKPYC